MINKKHILFIVNLLQDINIIRPLVYLAACELEVTIGFLVTSKFLNRDRQQIWQRELAQMCADIHGEMFIFETPAEAYSILQGKCGLLIAASESDLPGHADTHNTFRIAPSTFLRITLQHGYECVGFLQNREHNIAHGRNVTFAADVICGWCEPRALTALTASERNKLYVSGPSTILQVPVQGPDHPPVVGGIVCENLHSVRLRTGGNFGASFMNIFFQYCRTRAEHGKGITLRPHPGGQYVLKNNVQLPSEVTINNLPMYRVALKSYEFGISAPSTVVLDMVLAGIPVAVWHDDADIMDFSNYEGLTDISGLEDWVAFSRDVSMRPEMLLERQKRFLERIPMPTEPKEVYRRFARLLKTAENGVATPPVKTSNVPLRMSGRVLFIANGWVPTLQLSFLKPLSPMFENGDLIKGIITQEDMISKFGKNFNSPEAAAWLDSKIEAFSPDFIICSRYSGPHSEIITEVANRLNASLIFHVDDDLLNIPREIGERKFKSHNRPERLHTVRYLLQNSHLVYCSTKGLRRRFRELGFRSEMFAGRIYCAGAILNRPHERLVRKIGYMGFDHAHDFEIVLPVLVNYLRLHANVSFELFGSIPLPTVLLEFGDRVKTLEPVRDYERFLDFFAGLGWDIGLCPLALTPFNSVKANTKWVEYTSIGAAVIATKGMAYDDCCGNGRGILVDSDGWLSALEYLTDNPAARFQMVTRSQQHLEENYSEADLRQQVLNVLTGATDIARAQRDARWPHAADGTMSKTAHPVTEIGR